MRLENDSLSTPSGFWGSGNSRAYSRDSVRAFLVFSRKFITENATGDEARRNEARQGDNPDIRACRISIGFKIESYSFLRGFTQRVIWGRKSVASYRDCRLKDSQGLRNETRRQSFHRETNISCCLYFRFAICENQTEIQLWR